MENIPRNHFKVIPFKYLNIFLYSIKEINHQLNANRTISEMGIGWKMKDTLKKQKKQTINDAFKYVQKSSTNYCYN